MHFFVRTFAKCSSHFVVCEAPTSYVIIIIMTSFAPISKIHLSGATKPRD